MNPRSTDCEADALTTTPSMFEVRKLVNSCHVLVQCNIAVHKSGRLANKSLLKDSLD